MTTTQRRLWGSCRGQTRPGDHFPFLDLTISKKPIRPERSGVECEEGERRNHAQVKIGNAPQQGGVVVPPPHEDGIGSSSGFTKTLAASIFVKAPYGSPKAFNSATALSREMSPHSN